MNKILEISRDIEKSLRTSTRIGGIAVAGALLLTLVMGISSLVFAQREREKIYVLDQGKSLILAYQTDAVLNKELEIKDHVTRFHELMFTLSPQKAAIQENLDRAFNLSDRSAFDYSQDLSEKGYYARLVSANISEHMMVDSVVLKKGVYPYEATTFARHYVVRESTVSQYSFVSTCQLRNVGRSEVNPHGLLIEKFKVVQNDLGETRKR